MSQITTLDSIFGMPIQAIIDADYMAAKKTAEYIKEYGFNRQKNEDGSCEELGSLKETEFCYDTVGISGLPEKRVVRIPSLSLIPLPLLHVDNADFDFSVRILDTSEKHNEDRLNATLVPQKGNSRDNTSSPHLDANINVKLKVVQSDMPAGLSNLLALMGSNTVNVSAPVMEFKDKLIKIQDGKYCSTELYLKDSSGKPLIDALVKVSLDDDCGVVLACNRKHWKNGCSMLTDENGAIRFAVAFDSRKHLDPGTVIPLEFSYGEFVAETLNLYVE